MAKYKELLKAFALRLNNGEKIPADMANNIASIFKTKLYFSGRTF